MPEREPMTAVEETNSLLTRMANEVKGRKGVVLTPTAQERISQPDALDVGAPFPYDKPAQDIIAAFVRIEADMNFIREALGYVAAAPVHIKADKERPLIREGVAITAEPDPDFAASFKAKADAAQAATFHAPVIETGWVCPDHHKFIVKQTRTGRDWRVCPDCTEFEELT
jgi:hypothetical protein